MPGNNSHVTLCPWWNLFGHLKQAFCNWILRLRPCCLGPICCWSSGGLLCFFLHRGSVRAHICASQRHRTPNSEADGITKSMLLPLWGSFFGLCFVFFGYFSELCDFVKIELPCMQGLDFEGLGPSECYVVLPLRAPSENLRGPGGSCNAGGPRWKS